MRQKRISFVENYIDKELFKAFGSAEVSSTNNTMAKKAMQSIIQDELTARQREFILLHYFESHTMTEIAHIYGLSISSVSRTIMRAKEKILNRLKYYFIS